MSIVQMMGAAAVVGAGGSPVVSMVNDSSFCSSMTTTTSAIRANRDGTIDVQAGCSSLPYSQDYLLSGLSATVGDDYEASLSVISGDSPTSGQPLDTFVALTSNRFWQRSETPGQFASGVWRLTIREIADTGNVDTMDYSWDTEDGS